MQKERNLFKKLKIENGPAYGEGNMEQMSKRKH